MIGTEKSGPPAPEKPEPKPEAAPTPASPGFAAAAPGTESAELHWKENICAGPDNDERNDDGERAGSMAAATAAPRKPKTRAAAHTGSEMRQSMLRRRW